MEHFSPRRAVVTGAMSGIGRAAAELVLASGGRVLGVDRSEGGWEAPGFTARVADITDPIAVGAVFDEAHEVLDGAPDAVIHCAGVYRHQSILDLAPDEWDQIMRINSTGSFLVSQAAARVMPPGGSIVLLSSVAYGRGDAVEPCSAYSASKGAVVSLMQQLAVELGGRGIRVNAVTPGVIDTPMTTIVHDREATESLIAGLPGRRLGTAEDVATACVFLAGGASTYITGVVLPVDGGYLIS